MTARVIIPPKALSELRTDVIDFTPLLAVGQSVASAVATPTVYSGTDAAPAGVVTSAAPSGSGSIAVKYGPGVLGVIYQVTVVATTTSPAGTLTISYYLAVIPDLP